MKQNKLGKSLLPHSKTRISNFISRSSEVLIFSFLLTITQISAQPSEVHGGSFVQEEDGICLTDIQRQDIQITLKKNIEALTRDGKLPGNFTRSGQVLFDFPMAWSDGFDDYGFYGISNYVDHNLSYPGLIEDFACGIRSYDTNEGYNHKGTDFFLWPFAWNLVESNAVKVIAAAPGVIIGKSDGHDYHSCSFSTADWNAVYLMHVDGSVTWYGHMKKNSLTTKNIGDQVSAGEFLGIVGSSGNSTGPHLHFEVYDSNNNLLDPYSGPCNLWNEESWWSEQRSYIDPAINKIQTHFEPPVMNPCPQQDVINATDDFSIGDLVYLITYFKDQQNTDECSFSLIQPNDVVVLSWSFFSQEPLYYASYWYWTYLLPSDAIEGTWTFRCVFAGKTYVHHFNVSNGASALDDANRILKKIKIYPVQDQLILKAFSEISFEGNILILNTTGQQLYHFPVSFIPGENAASFSCSNIPPGIYFVTVISGDNCCLNTSKIVIE